MPLISVIIPAYNAESTILETIKSVQDQTFSNLEIILVDDGSTDGTLARVRGIRDERLKIVAGTHLGASAARNRGIEQARGTFVSFIDADDLWTPEKLELQLHALQSKPTAAIAYSWTAFIDQQGRFLFAKERMYFEGNVYAQLLRGCFIASGSNVLIRKSVIESTGLFDMSLRAAEDWEYWLRVAERWHFVLVPKYQILYRISLGKMSSDVATIEDANLIVLDRVLQTAAPNIRDRRNEFLANLKQYFALFYLTRTSGSQRRVGIGKRLLDAILLHPRIFFSCKTQSLLWTWLILQITPSSSAPQIVTNLLRLYGRLLMLVVPQLRTRSITARRK
jgi:glycosyltransferase involved in cell wall biosynthesis